MFEPDYFAARYFAGRYFTPGLIAEPAEQVLAARFSLQGRNASQTIEVSYEDRRMRTLNPALTLLLAVE
jgi:hypothetical protein